MTTLKLPEVPKWTPPKSPPKKIGTVADHLYEIRQRRLALAKVVAELQKQETFLKSLLIDEVPKSNASGVAGSIARVQIVPKSTPRTTDWDAFYKFMLKVKRPELLQKRLSVESIVEYWDAGKAVPGVEEHKFKDISLTKL